MSCALGCPYEGNIEARKVAEVRNFYYYVYYLLLFFLVCNYIASAEINWMFFFYCYTVKHRKY